MKRIIILGSFLLLGLSASAQKVSKKEWLLMYREYATYRCMCEITNNNLIKNLWDRKDLSFNVHSSILGNSYDYANSLGRKFARMIKPLQVDEESDLYGMKPLYQDRLNFFTSKGLAKNAKKSYRQFLMDKDK